MAYLKPIQQLLDTLPQVGRVTWIGVRSARGVLPTVVNEVAADPAHGLLGDHYSGKSGKRHVTLIQAEHLTVIGQLLGKEAAVDPALLRRNIVVAGINLLALSKRKFRVGEVVLEMTGLCHPCSKMETNLGPGGYNAIRGHAGITCRILKGGTMRLGDEVQLLLE